MSFTTMLWGMQVTLPTDINNHRKYAWIDRAGNFEGHILGGGLNDVFTGAHTYGEGSIVVVPFEEKAGFKTANPGHKGEIVTYHPDESLREVINDILKANSGCILDYIGKKSFNSAAVSGYTLTLDGEEVDESPFKTWFGIKGVFIGDHNFSPFSAYETFLKPFQIVFLAALDDPGKTWKSVLPSSHLRILLSLYPVVKQDLLEAVQHTNDILRSAITAWVEENEAYIQMFRIELGLRTQNKSLFFKNPRLNEHIARRRELTSAIGDELGNLTLKDMKQLEETDQTGEKLFVPAYMDPFLSPDPLFFRRLILGSDLDPAQKAAFQLVALFRFYDEETAFLDERFWPAMEMALKDFEPHQNDPGAKKFLNEKFWDKFRKDTSVRGEKVLLLINHPACVGLQALLSHSSLGKILDFPTLVRLLPGGDVLFGDRVDSFIWDDLPFLRIMLLQINYLNLQEANALVQTFRGRCIEVQTSPLYPVHFLGDLLEGYLVKSPPSRELNTLERGVLISRMIQKFADRIARWGDMMLKPSEDRTNVVSLFLGTFSQEGGPADGGKSVDFSRLDLSPYLQEMVASIAASPPESAELSSDRLFHLLSDPTISLLALIRGGCLGGLKGIVGTYGYTTEWDLFFQSADQLAWFPVNGAPMDGTFSHLLRTLHTVRTDGVEAARAAAEATKIWVIQ